VSDDWRERLRAACGPLVDAAAAAFPADAPRGVAGVRTLADLVAAHADADATEEEDRRFVEAAGAMLGLLLVDHAGDGAWVVRGARGRVRVGPRGFVDPFAIVRHALEADRPRRALAEAVAVAEAEAAGTGPLARVAAAVEERLAEVRATRTVVDRFEALLVLDDGTELDLGRVVAATRDQPLSAARAAAAKLVDLLLASAGGAGVPWDEAAGRLLPRLVPRTFAAPQGAPPLLVVRVPPAPVSPGSSRGREGAGDLPIAVALVLAYDGRARFVRADEPARWGHAPDALVVRAVDNLRDRSRSVRLVRAEDGGAAWLVVRSGDGLDSARLLLPSLREALLGRLGPEVRLAVPHRDTLLACSAADEPAVRAVRDRAREDAARAPHRISDALLRLTAEGLSV
jgi:hypothetical protein